jgi:hypothetical protein
VIDVTFDKEFDFAPYKGPGLKSGEKGLDSGGTILCFR